MAIKVSMSNLIIKSVSQILSKQPFIFIVGLFNKNIIRSSHFDIEVLIASKQIKTEIGSKVFQQCRLEPHCFIGANSLILPKTHVKRYASIGNNVVIGGAQHDKNLPALSTKTKTQTLHEEYTIIEEDSWIGNGVIIKSGTTIGRSSIVGMGTIQTKNTERYSINYGNPSSNKGMRINQPLIQSTEESKWWETEPQIAQATLEKIFAIHERSYSANSIITNRNISL